MRFIEIILTVPCIFKTAEPSTNLFEFFSKQDIQELNKILLPADN